MNHGQGPPTETGTKHRGLRRVAALLLLVGAVWFGHAITVRLEVPSGVRVYRAWSNALAGHTEEIRSGRLQAEPDPNGIVRYPLSDELRRAGVTVCIVHDGVIWYNLPSHPLDGGSPHLVTPLDRNEPVGDLPKRLRRRTYDFTMLDGNWAYWFAS